MDYNPFKFFEKIVKIEKKAWTNPFTFFEKLAKIEKKHGLTPLHFLKNCQN